MRNFVRITFHTKVLALSILVLYLYWVERRAGEKSCKIVHKRWSFLHFCLAPSLPLLPPIAPLLRSLHSAHVNPLLNWKVLSKFKLAWLLNMAKELKGSSLSVALEFCYLRALLLLVGLALFHIQDWGARGLKHQLASQLEVSCQANFKVDWHNFGI